MTTTWKPRTFIDLDEVHRALAILVDPDYWVELRGLPSGKSRIVKGSDLDGLCSAAEALSNNRNTYYCLNPIKSQDTSGTSDGACKEDIKKRRWMLIDVDPIKPDPDVSATDEEKEAARMVAEKIMSHLSDADWPAPAFVDSGNGWHLLYRVDLPNDNHAHSLIRSALHKLAAQFDSETAKVDKSVHNAARIAKLPGTWSRKGDSTKERPHRPCKLMHAPTNQGIVTAEQLEALAQKDPAAQGNGNPFALKASADHAAYTLAALEREVARVKFAAPGPEEGRNNALNTAGFNMGQLVGAGAIQRQRVIDELRVAAIIAGLSEGEIDGTLPRAVTDGEAKPRKLPEKHTEPGSKEVKRKRFRSLPKYVPFPVEVLPQPTASYVRQAAAALGCDPAFVALPVLAVLAATIGNTRVIRLKRGWHEPAVVWSVVIADSGTLKSPAWLHAVGYLLKVQKRLLSEYKAESISYEEAVKEWKQKSKQGDAGSEPRRPLLKRVVCADITIEKLAELLEDSERGLLLTRDELASWLASFTRYKDARKGGTDLPNWLEIHRAGTIVVDRKTGERKTLYVPRAAVSVTGGIQPGVIARALTPEFLDAGLAARLAMAMPPKRKKQWTEIEVHPDIETLYHGTLDRLANLKFAETGNEHEPHVLRLSDDAKATWIEFYNQWAREQAEAEGEIAAALSKLEAYAARFAMLHHVVTHAAEGSDGLVPVGVKSVLAGITLARWFGNEARRIYATLSESIEERETRRLIDWIRSRHDRTTVKDLQRSNSRKYPTTAAAKDALDALADFGYWQERNEGDKGGRPTSDFVLYPSDDTDETSKTSDDTPLKPEENGVSSVSSDASERNTTTIHGGFRMKAVGGFRRRVSSDDLPEDWRETWAERAAIREYDGGLSREEAEALALEETLDEMRRAGCLIPGDAEAA